MVDGLKERIGIKTTLVWIATVWSLWVARNKFLFEGKSPCLHDIVFNVKFLSWSWFSLRVKRDLLLHLIGWQGPYSA
jgi:hypothetical protein